MQGTGLREVALKIYNRPSHTLPPTTSLDSVAFFTHFPRGADHRRKGKQRWVAYSIGLWRLRMMVIFALCYFVGV